MANFTVNTDALPQGKLLILSPAWDFDSFPELGNTLISMLSASVKERQMDADLHTWLIDFEGTDLLLRAEHYSESIWLETLSSDEGQDVLRFIATLLPSPERSFT